jgi:imidazolonepropionase-like amidohydrolase
MWWIQACVAADEGPIVLRNARLPGGAAVDLEIRDGKLARVGVVGATDLKERDLKGAFVVPAVIDSHVHLAYYPVGPDLLEAGVVGVVDLAAPRDTVGVPISGGPRLRHSGPMITAIDGYPTTSWGANGYGEEVATAAAAEAAVRDLVGRGATVVKVPFESPALSDEALAATVATAHALGVPVVAHALDDAGAARAAAAGVDGLAHTPVGALSEATVAAWSGRFVISTVRAFGGSPAAVANLKALRAAGATVLYGTDLGNTRDVGIDREELALLVQAGLDGPAILAAATSTPAARWGWSDLGSLTPGASASFLVLGADPHRDPLTLADPLGVWIEGRER